MKYPYAVYKVHKQTNQKYYVSSFKDIVSAYKYCKAVNCRLRALGDDDLYEFIVVDQ